MKVKEPKHSRWRGPPFLVPPSLVLLVIPLLVHIFFFLHSAHALDSPPIFVPADSGGVNPTQIWLAERSPLNVKCPLNDPSNEVKISWIKDGVSIQGEKALFFDVKAVSREDGGVYQCLAKNGEGAALSWPMNVTVLYFDGFETSEESSDVFVKDLSSFIINVPTIKSNSPLGMSWRWFADDVEISSNKNYYITYTGSLVVLNPNPVPKKYRVEVLDLSSRKFIHYFTVKQDDSVLRTVSTFKIIFSPQDTTLIGGRARPVTLHSNNEDYNDAAVFECVPNLMDKISPEVKWFIDGDQVISNVNGVRVERSGRRLIIYQHLFKAGVHSAKIKCQAERNNGQKEVASAKLELLESPVISEEFDVEQVVSINDRLHLTCPIVVGWPRPKISWFKNGEKLENVYNTVKLDKITSKDLGIYQCQATNEVGLDIAGVWVHEQDQKMFVRSAEQVIAFSIINKPTNIFTRPGKDVVFHCETNDPHNSNVSWDWNNNLLEMNSNPRLSSNLSSLIIHDAHKSDVGIYTCVASNNRGDTVKATAELEINGVQLIQVGPSNQSIVISDRVNLPCVISEEVLEKENVKPIWSLNGRLIPERENDGNMVIDEQGQLVINQVTPEHIGLYKCTVRTSSDEESVEGLLQVVEKPGQPIGVNAELINDTLPAKIKVTWKEGFDGNSPIIKHSIEMSLMGSSGVWNGWETVNENIQTCCDAFIEVRPSSTAKFRVFAYNRHGQGRPSKESNTVTMPQQPPAASPKNVAASPRSSNSVMVQWHPPPADQWNGDILGYSIRYRLAGYNLKWNEKNVSKPDARNLLLENLITWREYEVQVAAYNHRGCGVYSKAIEVQPLEGKPMQAPQNVEVKVLSSTQVEVQFDPLEQQMIPGVNLGYKVEFWKGNTGENRYRQVNLDPDSSRMSIVIDELEKYGHYNVTVLCFTGAGDGPRSDAITVVTEEDVPGPVAVISFDQVQFSSVLVVWDPPTDPNGVLIKYILRHWETSDSGNKTTVEVSANEVNFTIEGLKASTQYSVDIQALTKVGASPRTEAKFESGVPPELPGRPSALTVTDVEARSAVLQFIPGFDGHSYIKRWIVEAKVGTSTVFTQIYNVSAPKARSFTVEKLRPFTKYQLRLIAENVRGKGAPSEPTRIFETQSTMPENSPEKVYAEPVAADRIQVVWSPLLTSHWNGEPKGYTIFYRALNPTVLGERTASTKAGEWVEKKISNHKTGETTLLDLEPYRTYQVKVIAENSFGVSGDSKVVTATTYEGAPSAGPETVAVDLHQQSVRVQWDEVPFKSRRGIIEGYHVKLVPEEQQLRKLFKKDEIVRVTDNRVTHFTFNQLRPFTAYRVFVSAYNLVGEGPDSSDSPLINTPQDIPDPPVRVKFGKVTNNSLILVWSPPSEPNGVITNYLLRHWREDKGEESAVSTVLPHNIYQFSAASLTPNTNYVFGIKAQSAVGVSSEVRLPVRTSTSPQRLPSPSTPMENSAIAPSSSTLAINWDKPTTMTENAHVREVEVEYQKTNEAEWTRHRRSVQPTVNKVQLTDLLPNMPYRVRIRYLGDFEEGIWSSESDWMKTLEAEPKAAPINVKARPYESSSILLEWTGLDPSLWNSDRLGYKILYRVYPNNVSFSMETLPLVEKNPEDGIFKHVIYKLSSFHHYIVQVQAYNNIGSSLPSKPPVFVYVGYSIPKQEIQQVNGNAQSSTSISVDWKAWEGSNDDVISGYKVRYAPVLDALSPEMKEEAEGGPSTEEIVITEKNNIVLTDLRKYIEYQISVCGYNRAGDGQSTSIRVKTLEDVPGPVGNLHFSDILLDSVNVSWSPPSQPNGRIINYIVAYGTHRVPQFSKNIQERTPVNFFFANNLEENNTYSFTIQAVTASGAGVPVSSNVTIGYNRGAPGAVSKPLVLPEQSGFLLKWNEGPSGSTPIKGYLIQAKRTGAALDFNGTEFARTKRNIFDSYRPQHAIGEWVTISNVLGSDSEYRVSYRQLEPSSYYVFRVFARNDLGVGLPSPTSERLHVTANILEDPFYTKWWFLVIVALIIVIIVILFVSVLCFFNSRSWKKETKDDAFDTHQLADGFVVSYGHNNNKLRSDDPQRPATQHSWLSNENIRNHDQQYGSVANGINQRNNNPYCTSSVYQALATDNVPDIHRNSKPVKTVNPYASKSQLNLAGGQGSANQNNYWSKPPVQVDVGPYGARVYQDDTSPNPEDDAEVQAERSFAGHYQTSNPQEETYRATWKRTREQTERQRAHSGRAPFQPGIASPVYLMPNRPDSEQTNETGQTGSDDPNPSVSSQREYDVSGIHLRTEFSSPNKSAYGGVQHGFSSFV